MLHWKQCALVLNQCLKFVVDTQSAMMGKGEKSSNPINKGNGKGKGKGSKGKSKAKQQNQWMSGTYIEPEPRWDWIGTEPQWPTQPPAYFPDMKALHKRGTGKGGGHPFIGCANNAEYAEYEANWCNQPPENCTTTQFRFALTQLGNSIGERCMNEVIETAKRACAERK